MTIFEQSQDGQFAYSLPKSDPAFEALAPPSEMLRKTEVPLPEVSELDLTRHFIGLSRRTFGIDNQFYPLGSCTMKFNPRINEVCTQLPGFSRAHPLAPDASVQGNLKIIDELLKVLAEICGMTGGTLLPNAGAQGELIGIKMIDAYHRKRGDLNRTEFLIPDSAHGTNPASAAMVGFQIRPIKTNAHGDIDLNDLLEAVSPKTAGLMLTNPSTLGLFSENIQDIAKIVHAAGGLLYYDGANMNPIMNIARPAAMGFDVMHLNLHKTFSTPHGGGGPGSGPVLCNDKLKAFLPLPRVEKRGNSYATIWKGKDSIGQIASFHGNFGIYLRAYVYILMHGHYGLRKIAEQSVLNANYLKHALQKMFTVPFPQPCMHEFVIQADRFLPQGIKALDIAKRLLDYKIHSPTVYFPQIIKECFLIEPTESESKNTLDQFIAAMAGICKEAEEQPGLVKSAPHTTPVSRLDETEAARHPVLIDPLVLNKLNVKDLEEPRGNT